MIITIRELIGELEKIEDKDTQVLVSSNEEDYLMIQRIEEVGANVLNDLKEQDKLIILFAE